MGAGGDVESAPLEAGVNPESVLVLGVDAVVGDILDGAVLAPEVAVLHLPPLKALDDQEQYSQQESAAKEAGGRLVVIPLRRVERQHHRQAAQQQYHGIDDAKDEVRADDVGGRHPVRPGGGAVAQVGAQQCAEDHHLGQQENPGPELTCREGCKSRVVCLDFLILLGGHRVIFGEPHDETGHQYEQPHQENEPERGIAVHCQREAEHDAHQSHRRDYRRGGAMVFCVLRIAHDSASSSETWSVGISAKLLGGGGEEVVHSSDQPPHGSALAFSPPFHERRMFQTSNSWAAPKMKAE